MRSPLHSIHRAVRGLAKNVLVTGTMVVGLLAGQMPSAALSFGYDVIIQVEDILHQAAKSSPHWDSRQDAIRRDVHDITFSLEQAWKAAEHSRHAETKDYAEQALLILQRGTARGYFNRTKTEPVRTFINGLLSKQTG